MKQGIKLLLAGMVCITLSLSATIVHVVLLLQDPATKKWEILLSRNVGTALWTDFDNTGSQEPVAFAKATIRDFTNGRYNELNAPMEKAIDLIQYGQHFFFVPVTERLYGRTMRKARNKHKHDFTWVPMDEFLGYRPVYDSRLKKSGLITAEPNMRAVVRIVWPEVQKGVSVSVAHEALNGNKKVRNTVRTDCNLGCGGWIRTSDLWVMSPTSYQTALPRYECRMKD